MSELYVMTYDPPMNSTFFANLGGMVSRESFAVETPAIWTVWRVSTMFSPSR